MVSISVCGVCCIGYFPQIVGIPPTTTAARLLFSRLSLLSVADVGWWLTRMHRCDESVRTDLQHNGYGLCSLLGRRRGAIQQYAGGTATARQSRLHHHSCGTMTRKCWKWPRSLWSRTSTGLKTRMNGNGHSPPRLRSRAGVFVPPTHAQSIGVRLFIAGRGGAEKAGLARIGENQVASSRGG